MAQPESTVCAEAHEDRREVMYQLDKINQTLESFGAGNPGAVSDLQAAVLAAENAKSGADEKKTSAINKALEAVHKFCDGLEGERPTDAECEKLTAKLAKATSK